MWCWARSHALGHRTTHRLCSCQNAPPLLLHVLLLHALAGALELAGFTEAEPDPEPYDPYTPLDPHSRGTLPLRPYRKSRRTVKWPKPAEQSEAPVSDDAWFTVPPPAPKGLAFPEFLYALRIPDRAAAQTLRGTADAGASHLAAYAPQVGPRDHVSAGNSDFEQWQSI